MDCPNLVTAIERGEPARAIAALRPHAERPLETTVEEYGRLEGAFLALAEEARSRLLGTSLAWSDEERRIAAWLRTTYNDLAITGYALCQALGSRNGWNDSRTRLTAARTLCYMGDVVKWDVSVARDVPHDFAKPHALMRAAMVAGQHREPLRMRFDGRDVSCTLESLYFRALLLARFSSGVLNTQQIEILDAWMWMWMPALHGVEEPPHEGALRADLDTPDGLRLGPRAKAGPTLYLPPGPIEEAYRSIVREFHAGRMVPAEGVTTGFRIEEHVAVLDLVRRGLREASLGHVSRAERHATDLRVELHAGLSEIMRKGLCPPPPSAPALALAALDGERVQRPRAERDRDTTGDEPYERRRRIVRVANMSETGLGLEGDAVQCAGIAVGEIVALRLEPGGALEIGKVVRCVPGAAQGRTWIGVRRMSARARVIQVVDPGAGPGHADSTLIFVPGADECGRHDACLVSERTYTNAGAMDAYLSDCVYTFRFNRPRDRGRGWVLAGFEIVAATATQEKRMAR